MLASAVLPDRPSCWQGDDMTDRFLRIMTNLAVSHSLANETSAQRPSQLSYLALDAYVRLIVLLVNCKPLIVSLCTVYFLGISKANWDYKYVQVGNWFAETLVGERIASRFKLGLQNSPSGMIFNDNDG